MGFIKGGGSGGGGGGSPTGPAGGDLAGTYPNPTVGNISILTTTGDILYESSPGVVSRLPVGTVGQVLTVAGGIPSWAAAGGGAVSSVFGRTGTVVAVTNDYTDAQVQNSPTNKLTTTGDTLYASAANTLARLAIGSTGQVLTVAAGIPNWATPPGTEIGYDQITASVTVTSTSEPSGTTVIACAAHTFDGSPVLVEFFCPYLQCTGGTGTVGLAISLFEGATELGILCQMLQTAGGVASNVMPAVGKFRFTPSAASHTYTVTGAKIAGSPAAIVNCGAGGVGNFVPAYCRFTKI